MKREDLRGTNVVWKKLSGSVEVDIVMECIKGFARGKAFRYRTYPYPRLHSEEGEAVLWPFSLKLEYPQSELVK